MKKRYLILIEIAVSAIVFLILKKFDGGTISLILGMEIWPEDTMQTGRAVDFLQLFYWLWLVFPLWFCVGYMLDECLRMQKITINRYGSAAKWWIDKVFWIFILNLCHCLPLYLIMRERDSTHKAMAVLLIAVHSLAMLISYSAVFLATGRRVFSTGLLIFTEVFGFALPEMAGISPKYIPFMWSMYARNSGYADGGFCIPAAVSIQLAVAVAVTAAMAVLVKKTNILWRVKREDC